MATTVTSTLNVVTSFTTSTTHPFRVVATVTAQTGFPDLGLFVFRKSDNGFDHVAKVSDFQYPLDTPSATQAYYRKATAQVDYTTLEKGTEGRESFQTRVDALTLQYAEYKNAFDADVTKTYSHTVQ